MEPRHLNYSTNAKHRPTNSVFKKLSWFSETKLMLVCFGSSTKFLKKTTKASKEPGLILKRQRSKKFLTNARNVLSSFLTNLKRFPSPNHLLNLNPQQPRVVKKERLLNSMTSYREVLVKTSKDFPRFPIQNYLVKKRLTK